MTASADFKAPAVEQMLLRGLLQGFLRLFFRGLVRPPMPVAGQRRILRALTAITLTRAASAATARLWPGALASGIARSSAAAAYCSICMAARS